MAAATAASTPGLACRACGLRLTRLAPGLAATPAAVAAGIAAAEAAHAARGCGVGPPPRVAAGGTLFVACDACGCVEAAF